jgi:hypothetical protein
MANAAREDKMTRRSDGTYQVVLEGLTLNEAVDLLGTRRANDIPAAGESHIRPLFKGDNS